MRAGVYGLATIACLAPWVGIFGTILGIMNSFRGGITGDRWWFIAGACKGLSESLWPTALGIFVGLIAFLAAATGDNVGFALGRLGGRRLLDRFGRYALLSPVRIDAASRWFERHGTKVVVVARFIEGLRQVNGLLAGISTMQWRRFVVFNAIGAALWVAAWTSAGYLVGGHIVGMRADSEHGQWRA